MSEFLTLIAEARSAALDRRFDAAAAGASDVLARVPSSLLALRILAWAQLEQGLDEALQTFERCAAYDPQDALAYVGQAIWYQQRGQDAAAVRQWVQAWELDPDNQAIRRAVVRLTGDLPESSFADAISLLRAGHEGEAADVLRHLGQERREVSVGLTLVDTLWAIGQRREAFDLALAIHVNQGQSVKAALYVAALEDGAGRTLHSREAIARAEHVDPGLTLFSDVVRMVGLESALDQHRASRATAAVAR
jgi:tetratricopeptide (TPR) repeat protein